MAKVTTSGGKKTYELTDAERRSLRTQLNQTYSEEDRQRLQYTAADLERSIVNAVNSDSYQDAQALSDTQRRIETYQRNLRTLGAMGYDTNAAMENLRSIRNAASQQSMVHSQFGSREEYDLAVQYARDLEELDLEAAWAELDALKQERDAFAQGAAGNWASGRLSSLFSGNNRGQNVSLDDFANMSFEDMRGYIDDVNASYGIGDAKLRDYDRRITERQQYLTQIERARSLTDMEAVVGNADFAENSAYTGNRAAGSAEAYRTYRYINDPEYRENYANARYANPNNVYSRTASAAATVLEPEEYESIDQMNEDEIAVFNYYYNTQGEEAAMAYLNALTPTIRQRRAAERFAELQGRTGAELAFGVAAGLDQFGSGLRGLVSREEQSPSWRQYTSSMVREDLEDNRISRNSNAENSIGQVAYDAITSGANMLPSILASSLVGLINPVAGQVTGAALMGASASGNAYQEMLNLGYDKGQARAYSLLVGGSEAALSSILGGITKLGGALPKGVTNALLQNVDNAVKRVAIQLGSNVVSEFSEEYLQEVISAVLQNEILRAGNDLSQVTSDALYSGLLGALTAVGFEGGGTITGAVQTRNTGKQFLESEAKLSDLHALASMMPDVESVQNLAPRVNENSNAYTVGRFYEEVTGAMGEQNKADLAAVRRDVLAELETAGITGTDANTIAKAVEAEITGKKLTESQQRLIARVGQSVPRIGEIIERGVNSDRADAGIARSLVHSKIAGDMNAKAQKSSEVPTAAEKETPPTTQAAQQNVSQANSADTSTTIAEAAKNTGVTEAALSRVYAMGGENQSEEAFSAAAEEVVNFAEESTLPAEEVLSYVNTLASASVLTQGQRSALVDIGRDSIRLAYNIGYAGQNINDALENKRLSRYDKAEITAAYNKGAEAYKAKIGSMPQAATEAKTRKSGTVRFEGDAQEFLRKFNKAQRSAYRIMSRLAEITGVNVVLYESAADTQGRYSGVQGSFDPKDPNTVRVDINAGLSGEADIGKLAEYTMLRTFTHEFVHSFEINAPRQYAELKRVVFEQMRQNGKDVTDLIERKIVEYGTDENGNDLLTYDDASHEVLAESLTEVLPQSQFVETLVTKHRIIFDKIYEALKRFVALIKARFAEMNQGTMKAEAKALMQEMDGVLQYTQNIVDAFDKAALAATETVQSRNAEAADQQTNENPTGKVRYQARETLAKAAEAMESISDDEYLRAKSEYPFVRVMDHTPKILLDSMAGEPKYADREIIIRRDALYLAIRNSGVQDGNYHGLGADVLKGLPKYIEDPDVILQTDGSSNRRVVLSRIPAKTGQAVISVEFESLKDVDSKYDYYNVIVTVFDLKERYLRSLFAKRDATIKYKKEDLAQVNPQLHDSLRIINAKSSNNVTIPQTEPNVNPTRSQRRENLTDREVLERAAKLFRETLGDSITGAERTSVLTEVYGQNFTEAQLDLLNIFSERLAKLKDLQAQRREQGQLYYRYTQDKDHSKRNRDEAIKAKNRMELLDRQILAAGQKVREAEGARAYRDLLQNARAIVEQTEQGRIKAALERYRDRQDNSAAIRKYRSRILTDVETLTGWLMKPDNKSVVKHIPEALHGSVVPFLQSIDFTSKQQLSGGAATKADVEFMKRLNALRDVMKEYAPDANTYEGYADLPTDFMERLDKLVQEAYDLTSSGGETFVINRMTSAELHELSYLVKRVKKFVQDFNVFHNNSMFKHVYDAGENSIGALAKMTDAGREANSVNDFLQWQQILPAYAWERFGDGGVSIFRELMRAQDQLGFNAKRIIDFSEKAFTKKEIDAWRKQIVEIKLKSGETMSIPATYLMGLYELSKREAGLRHILGNGIKTGKWKEGKNDGGKSFEIAQEDLDTMFKNLSERQKQVADALQTFMQSVCADWGNYVTMARFGEKQFGDPHYYPIVSDSNNRDAKSDEAPQATGLYSLLNMGFTKQLNEKANDRIMLYDIFDVFANHAADMAQYNAFALPVVDALKWFNYKQKDAAGKMTDSVREQMDRVYGVPKSGRGYAQAFVTGVLQAINGTETQGSKYDAPSLKMLGLYNRSQVAYNARVVIQQPTAIVRAALVLDPNSVLRALTVKNLKKNMQEMQEHSGIAVWKDLGFYDVNISRNLTGMILQDKNFGDKFVEAGMAGAEAADKLTWSWMWAACKEEVIAKQKLKPGDDGFFEAVSAKFDEVIYKTQVVDSVLTKNAYMRDKGATAKTLSSFMSESVRNASMVMDAAERLNRAKRSGMSDQEVWKKHGKYFGRAVVVYCVGNILNAFAQSIPDMVRDDDEYEKLWEKFLDAFGSNIVQNLNPLNIVPLVSNIWDAVKGLLADVAKAGGKDTNLYSYQPETIFGQWYDALSGGFIELVKRLNGDTNYTWWGTVGKLLKGISALSGMPLGNIYRTVVNTWNITAGLISPSLRIKSYDPGEKAEIKYAYLDGYLTEEEASELLMQIVDEDGESMSADDAYWVIREWDGGEDYSRFGGLYEAVLGGKDLDPAMEELLAHGYTEKDLLSEAKSEIGRAFRDGEITREKAEELLGKYFDMTDEQVSSLVNEWRAAAETDIAYGDIGTSFLAGDITRAKATEMYMEYGGKTEEEAEEIMNHLQFEQDTGHAWEDLEDLFVDGTISANSAEQYLMEYGGAYRLDAQTTVRQWECEKETGIKYSDIRSLYVSGDLTAQRAQDLRVEYGGASLDDARKLILKWKCEIDNGVRYEDIGAAFLSGDITRSEAIEWQMTYGEKDEDEADLYVTAYQWRNENPEYGDLSDSAIGRYIEHCEPAGVPAGLFYEARHFCSDIESDGTRGNVKDQYIDYITSLPVSFEQQNALWLALKNTTWSDSGTPFA